jgi:hypothetical protein
MKTDRRFIRNVLCAGIATAGFTSFSAQAYGPLYVFDYESGTPWRWDVTEPVDVWVDGGNFASGTVRLRNPDLPTCNAEGGWQCYEDVYVEFTNEQGVARVTDALASWSAVPTSSFQAAVAGNFAEIGIGGEDGDITGAPEEFFEGEGGEWVHEIIGSVNNGGIHVLFDEDGAVMTNVIGAPYGVLGIASPEWGDESTGTITEGWVVIGGGQTYYNDTDLAQMAGVITHELGHSFNLAHTQTNGHVVMYGNQAVTTTGPVDCSAHWWVGGEYRLPYPQVPGPAPEHMAVMYPFIDHNPDSWNGPTGHHQATADTVEDHAAISSVYPAASFASETGTITGTVTFPFSREGIIGVNVVARNIDNPFGDAVTAMTGDWNDGEPGAAQGAGEYKLQGLTPGARYVIQVENIFAGGFPTPQVLLPGPSEYYSGAHESDDATRDDACHYEEVAVEAGATRSGIDIQVNGMKKTPQLVINPAPNANNVTEDGQTTGGTILSGYGVTESWIHHAGRDDYTILPLGSITLSDNGSVIGAETIVGNEVFPARLMPGKEIEILPSAGNSGCDQGSGILEYYSHFAISPDGNTMGGFLWNCDKVEGLKNFTVSAVTYDDVNGWRILNDHFDSLSARVNAVSNNQVAVGWSVRPNSGWWEGRVWVDGQEINMQDAAPANIMDIGEVTGVSSDGSMAVGINSWDDQWNQRGYTYNVENGELTILDIAEECPWWDWFCFGSKPFNPYDIADDGTMVGAIGTASGAGATLVSDLLGTQKLTDFLRGQGVINAADLEIASTATKISSNGRHIVGWTAVDGYFGSFKLTLDQLWVCRKGKSMQVGYPIGVATQMQNGATLGMCEDDLPLQYKGNY